VGFTVREGGKGVPSTTEIAARRAEMKVWIWSVGSPDGFFDKVEGG